MAVISAILCPTTVRHSRSAAETMAKREELDGPPPCGWSPARDNFRLSPNLLRRKPGGGIRDGASTRCGAGRAWAGIFVRTYLRWKLPMGVRRLSGAGRDRVAGRGVEPEGPERAILSVLAGAEICRQASEGCRGGRSGDDYARPKRQLRFCICYLSICYPVVYANSLAPNDARLLLECADSQ